MSLHKVGKPTTRHRSDETSSKHAGIPGSKQKALFYQEGKTLPTAERAEGIYIYDTEGKQYLDGCSGAFAVSVGHHHPRVVAAAKKQLDKITFAYRTQFETEAANDTAELVTKLCPKELNRVFFVNSGSEAVEASLKLARQYWWAKNRKGKTFVIARRPSYHGATLGALSCTDYAPLNIPFQTTQIYCPKVSAPFCYHCPLEKTYPECNIACAWQLEHIIAVHGKDNIAAFIAEPIGGASVGGAVPPEEYFPIVEQICHDNEVLLIMDEVLTGCGRTGTFFGYAHWNITPDIVALSKGLSGGYTPIGACISSDEIVQTILNNGGFLHGHTYAGNPLSTAIAKEVLTVVVEENLVENARKMGTYLHERLRELMRRYVIIGDVRGRGLLAGIEFVRNREKKTPFPFNWYVALEATEIARELGLIIYPRRSRFGLIGDHVSIAPPLIIDKAGIDEIIDKFDRTLQELTEMTQSHLTSVIPPVAAEPLKRYEQTEEMPDYAVANINVDRTGSQANISYALGDKPPVITDEDVSRSGMTISHSPEEESSGEEGSGEEE